MKKIFALLLVLIFLIGLWFYLEQKYPTTTPLKSAGYFAAHLIRPHAKMEKESVGFLPYWRIEDAKSIRLDLITQVDYFGLVVDDNGEFVKVVNNETDPGWREWNSQTINDLIAKTQIMGADFSFTVVSQRNTTIENILDDEKVQEKLIANISDQIKSRKLDGVNIDFEYLGDVDQEYKDKFTEFSKRLSDTLRAESPKTKLAVSIMPRAGRSADLFDFPKIVPMYDRFIGMSYDYYGISSDIAGPVAPMTGFKENKYFFDVETTYEDYLKSIPREKILMGVPHYGWDWAVEDGQRIQSLTFPLDSDKSYAAVMSYGRARTDKNLKENQCEFDDYAKSSWCWYTDPKTKIDHQVWIEDNKSIGIKYDYANKQDFAGIAIWVLGYDKDYPDLWNLLKDKFGKN